MAGRLLRMRMAAGSSAGLACVPGEDGKDADGSGVTDDQAFAEAARVAGGPEAFEGELWALQDGLALAGGWHGQY